MRMKTKLLSLLVCGTFLFYYSCKKDAVVADADLMVTETVDNLTPVIGTNITFTIVAKNNGPGDATGVDVTDNLPTGYMLVSSTATIGTVGNRAWTIGSLKIGATATLTMVVTVLPTGIYPHSVSILGSETDPSTLNNSALVTVVPVNPKVDLALTQTVNNSAPVVGTDVTFKITVKNNGTIEASGVTVSNSLPSGYTFVSATPSAGSWTAPTWTIGKLAGGASIDMSVVAKVNASGSYANTATVTGTEADSNTANNTATTTTVPVPAVTAKVTYDKDIKPLLTTSCTPCHVAGGSQPNHWDVYATTKSNINAIIDRTGRAQGSGGFMPNGGTKLSASDLALLSQWVTDGLLEK